MDFPAQSATRTAKGVILAPLFSTGGVLVGPDDGTVDQLQRLRRLRRALRQFLEHFQPDIELGPAVEPVVDRGAGAIVFRQVAPWRPGAQNVEDPVHHPSVVNPVPALARLRRQRLDQPPLLVAQIVPRHENLPPAAEVNHDLRKTGIPY